MQNLYDVVVIGGGPAGLTAALYLARAKYRVVVVEKEKFGGQITITHEVVNYPGVGRSSGAELTETMRAQAESFGAEFMLAEVGSLAMSGEIKTVKTDRGELRCFGVLLATGAHPRMVGFDGEADASAITEHIKNIRAKLRATGSEPIETVWGVGYKWKNEP